MIGIRICRYSPMKSPVPAIKPRSCPPLGSPLPGGPHSVSVSLPRWEDVVGYEEKRPETIQHIKTGYPRFVVHEIVARLARAIEPGGHCLPFPSLSAARRCVDYIRHRAHAQAEIRQRHQIWGVVTDGKGDAALKEFWQHAGLGVSSRHAHAALDGAHPAAPGDPEPGAGLREILAGFYDCSPRDVFLAPTGMAAQFAALAALNRRRPGKRTVQLGFPYVDTLKLQERLGCGAFLLHQLGTLTRDLEVLLSRESVAGCFAEIPGNPLLGCADLRAISPILRAHRVPLVADDVVATPFNIDLSARADLIATSLTKFIAGSGEVMGGALVCNPKSPLYPELRTVVAGAHEELLWHEDARELAGLARNFPERMRRHNENGLLIAERLREHPAIERVWYPKWESSHAYEGARRPGRGWGALITFLPRDASRRAPAIYDALPICKGPSLGTVFTLACPFTLLAHYTELQWAEACGVPAHLIRLSIGLEDPEALWNGIERALRS